MSAITIRPISKENEVALRLPNDPFLNTGRVIPHYDGKVWSYEIERFTEDKITTDCFPDENYSLEELGGTYHGLAAYIGDECVGFALFEQRWNKYLYLDNLLVPAEHRRSGVGRALVEAGMELAKSLGDIGVWLVCQNNNLPAMEFYIQMGFELGGMDARSYDGTKLEGVTDLHLYRKA